MCKDIYNVCLTDNVIQITPPLSGALLGWLILKNSFGPLVYGITFGLISGMMVFISLKELLPTAYRFDTTNGKVVSVSLVAGMLVMASSLVLEARIP